MGRAIILIMSGFIMIFTGYKTSIQQTANETAANSVLRYSRKQARYIAESGVNAVLTQLRLDPYYRGIKTSVPVGGGFVDITVIDRNDLGDYTVEVKSVATYFGTVDSAAVVIDLIPLSDRFSLYSYFSNSEDGIWFYSSDTLSGPVHTNGRFNMTGTPVFYGHVSSVSPTYDTFGPTDPRFLGGTDFGSEEILLSPDFSDLQSAAQAGGHLVLNNKLYLRFLDDGTYDYKIGSTGSWQNTPIPQNGVIAGNKDIFVEGTVKGQVTISTTASIYIVNDILYSRDPLVYPDSEDIVGLVAGENVTIQDNPANRQGCTIHASILAKNGSFRAANINFYPTARLEIFGGIIQEHRGAVGRLGGPPSGFEKFYEYDERLEYLYPPFFPVAPGSTVNTVRTADIEVKYWKK